jgi:hypothetical protein
LFTDDEIHHPERFREIYTSTNDTALDAVSFVHHSSACEAESLNCRYIVTSYGKDKGVSKFAVQATYKEDSEILLIAGIPIKRLTYWNKPVYLKYMVETLRPLRLPSA